MFTASCDKTCKMWDLQSNQATVVAEHAAPIKSVHWIQAPNYSCLVTASWDKTMKVATPSPIAVMAEGWLECVASPLAPLCFPPPSVLGCEAAISGRQSAAA